MSNTPMMPTFRPRQISPAGSLGGAAMGQAPPASPPTGPGSLPIGHLGAAAQTPQGQNALAPTSVLPPAGSVQPNGQTVGPQIPGTPAPPQHNTPGAPAPGSPTGWTTQPPSTPGVTTFSPGQSGTSPNGEHVGTTSSALTDHANWGIGGNPVGPYSGGGPGLPPATPSSEQQAYQKAIANSPYPGFDPNASPGMTTDKVPYASLGGAVGGANAISEQALGTGTAQSNADQTLGYQSAQNLSNIGQGYSAQMGQMGTTYAQGLGAIGNQYQGLGQKLGTQGNAFAGSQGTQGNNFSQAQQGQYQGLAAGQGAGIANQGSQMAGLGTAQYGGGAGAEQSALANLSGAASGNAPSAAQSQMQQGLDQSVQAQMAMANSTRGGFGLAEAQKNAQSQGAAMQQAGVQQSAQLRAQEMSTAREQYMQGAQGVGQQGITEQQLGQSGELGGMGSELQSLGLGSQYGLAGMQYGQQGQEFGMNYGAQGQLAGMGGQLTAYGQAANTQLGALNNAAQTDINATDKGQAQQLAYAGLGQGQMDQGEQLGLSAQQAEMNAQIANEQTAAGLSTAQTAANTQLAGAGVSAAGVLAAGALAAADADLVEPGGDAHWTLREEPNILLAKNQRTGEMGKVRVDPLSPEEEAEVHARHGAGPLAANSPRRQRTRFYSDMDMNNVAEGKW